MRESDEDAENEGINRFATSAHDIGGGDCFPMPWRRCVYRACPEARKDVEERLFHRPNEIRRAPAFSRQILLPSAPRRKHSRSGRLWARAQSPAAAVLIWRLGGSVRLARVMT